MNDNTDLLNLCRLNLMEEHVKDTASSEDLQAIAWKKKQLADKIISNEPSEDAS